jgi:uncharacterized protein with beta-barrel porin domain
MKLNLLKHNNLILRSGPLARVSKDGNTCGASFVVNGAAQAADSALVTASVDKKWLNGFSAAATFEGEFSSVTASYAGKGVVRYQW